MQHPPSIDDLVSFGDEIDAAHLALRARYQTMLDALEGMTYGTIEQRRKVAERIQAMAMEIGCRFRCTTCGEPAKFQWSRAGTGSLGGFSFSHNSVTTHRVGSSIPQLTLIDPPEDKRKRKSYEE